MGGILKIEGGRPLNGTVRIPAAKNSVLPLMAAALLCSGPVVFCGVPALADVAASLELLRAVGCGAEKNGEKVTITPPASPRPQLPEGPARAMRSSVFYLAPLLHRAGRVSMPLPGGCRIGARPIDIHLDGLAAMGARVKLNGETLELEAPRGLKGVDWRLRLPSVGATETLMMAAALAKGPTVLRGAACEPEIVDLANFLKRCGALICGAGTPTLWVQGAKELSGAEFTPLPDRITAATLAAAAAACGGRVRLQNCPPGLLAPQLALLQKAGCGVKTGEDEVEVLSGGGLKGEGAVFTGGYPAFATDAAPVTAAAFLKAKGEITFWDTLFENRFTCGEGFARLGADVTRQGRRLTIRGVEELTGARLMAPDLRGGAALVTAALCARGQSILEGAEHIDRGYEDIAALYRGLGAEMSREEA